MSNRKPLIFLWLFFHLFAVVVFIIRHENAAKIDTNFLSITPKFLEDKDFQKPLEDFFLKNSSTVKIFVESEDFDIAKDNALKLEEYSGRKGGFYNEYAGSQRADPDFFPARSHLPGTGRKRKENRDKKRIRRIRGSECPGG